MKKLLLTLSAIALAAASCTNADPVRDALLERAGNLATVSDVTYDPSYSSNNVLAVYWNPDDAVAAGASSFKVAASEDLFEFVDDSGTSNTILVEVKVKDDPNDSAQLSKGIVSGTGYYVKVAAVYPGPSTSAWIYLLGEDGQPVKVVPGVGPVSQ